VKRVQSAGEGFVELAADRQACADGWRTRVWLAASFGS
jgi:hypothetical protein